MKLSLSGPQAITIFPVKNTDSIPTTAKSASFATPQGYVCLDTGNIRMYIKGHEYNFVSKDTHEELIAEAIASASVSAHATHGVAEGTHAEMHSDIHDRLEEMEEKLHKVCEDTECLMNIMYHPIKKAMMEHGK